MGKIVKEFTSRGYKLADSFLNGISDSINNIQFILGAKSAYCLLEKIVTLE